jgi:uncharacterized protein (DUF58 family)
LVIKQYQEDTNLRCLLLVDGSDSMSYPADTFISQQDNKFEYACTLAACLALVVLRQQDAVGSVLFDSQVRSRIPLRASQSHLLDILTSFENSRPANKTDMEAVLKDVAQTSSRRGVMVLISDLLGTEDSSLRGIAALRKAGHDVVVLHVLHDDELDFPFSDPTRFEGLESLDQLTCNPKALREGYLESLQRFLDKVRRGCAAAGCDYMLIRTSDAIDAVLSKLLHDRMHSVRN